MSPANLDTQLPNSASISQESSPSTSPSPDTTSIASDHSNLQSASSKPNNSFKPLLTIGIIVLVLAAILGAYFLGASRNQSQPLIDDSTPPPVLTEESDSPSIPDNADESQASPTPITANEFQIPPYQEIRDKISAQPTQVIPLEDLPDLDPAIISQCNLSSEIIHENGVWKQYTDEELGFSVAIQVPSEGLSLTKTDTSVCFRGDCYTIFNIPADSSITPADAIANYVAHNPDDFKLSSCQSKMKDYEQGWSQGLLEVEIDSLSSEQADYPGDVWASNGPCGNYGVQWEQGSFFLLDKNRNDAFAFVSWSPHQLSDSFPFCLFEFTP